MSDLTPKEKALLESFLGMSEGYVLDFSNRTFAQFFADTVGIDIEDEKYTAGGDSKAKRLRAFWSIEDNLIVAKALAGMLERVSDNPADQPLARRRGMLSSQIATTRAVIRKKFTDQVELMVDPNSRWRGSPK